MKTQAHSEADNDSTLERTVADYLRTHPQFFETHLNLLTSLTLPHHTGSAVSLVERQVGMFREQNRDLKDKLLELVNVARDNDHLSQRLHRLTLSLMEARCLTDVLHTLDDKLRTEFQADVVRIRLFEDVLITPVEDEQLTLRRDDPALEAFSGMIRLRRPQCGTLKPEQIDALFGAHAAVVASAVLVPLGGANSYGLLAVGSTDPQRFRAGLGKVFLTYLGELASAALRPYLAADSSA